jgi:hypothetical protein
MYARERLILDGRCRIYDVRTYDVSCTTAANRARVETAHVSASGTCQLAGCAQCYPCRRGRRSAVHGRIYSTVTENVHKMCVNPRGSCYTLL